ncbi:flagellar biosynthesis protein FlhB [Anoxybacillus flavithermus]|uniref:flagellar biosynthesis protein FlhB n=1 Tax=Anoxybacillus flavithermus TaxID=33934 RepID=UPI0007D973B0|nr:flagellar biosynthesis protein FlhB [Anoxybacillus flavithermus]MBE2939535.1 flagellar biosynthesis protein FlhB [Anoxybacillus flavithermus]MBE2942365.1 flagellar biosynthesis protein FlhB [Anoxybacillus flavithermus]MBE2950600.1 flagellar biosynthesis protein FlhB [Anoxybacillus flavithermus]MBE2953261.1 flagellar biosynthesis protein FlhB [Anoxybacillus flavithermus]MBE2958595.1 flagellar biosynthesis protein FlhB [Anoxybacillus flavithermus]
MSWLSVDLQFFAGEKTEKATPRKRQEVRKKGQVAKSADVTAAFLMLIVFLVLSFSSGMWRDAITRLFRQSFQHYFFMDVTIDSVQLIFVDLLQQLALLVGPIFLAAIAAALFANFVQVGFLFTTEPLQMKLSKLDPIQGFKRIFSLRALVELLKSILKVLFVGVVTFSILWMHIDDILSLSHKSVGAIAATLGRLTIQMGLVASVALLFLSLFDYLYQRYDFEKNIRMSKQDIKDEYKKTEGDPLIKSRIKQKQREMAMRRMMQEVPKADVVITNPTHFAVALKYDEQQADAPIVVAKGADYMAQKIKDMAKKNDVMIVENRPLARALYDQTDVGMVIPEAFFKAVAEILAYVYKTKNKL